MKHLTRQDLALIMSAYQTLTAYRSGLIAQLRTRQPRPDQERIERLVWQQEQDNNEMESLRKETERRTNATA